MSAAVPCNACHGQGGGNETSTGSNGAAITTWRTCTRCGGKGHVG